MESFSMTDKDILYVWHKVKGEKSVILSPKLSLADFTVEDTRTEGVEVEKGSKTYSSLIVQLTFLRSGNFSLVFLLSSILVFISWFGLFLDEKLTTEKILLFLIPEVVSISIIFWIRTMFLLSAPYVSSIECFIIFCAVMIFFTSIQFVAIYILNNCNSESGARILDWLSKIAFPVVFVVFQSWFWVSG
jgi:hypothetical protein